MENLDFELESRAKNLLIRHEDLERDIRQYGIDLKNAYLPYKGKVVEILDDKDVYRIGQEAVIEDITVIGMPLPRVTYKVVPINKKYLNKGEKYISLRPNQVKIAAVQPEDRRIKIS